MESISPSVSDTHETSVSLVHLWLLKEDVTETGAVHYNGDDDDGNKGAMHRWFP